jgi:hypothetical protein
VARVKLLFGLVAFAVIGTACTGGSGSTTVTSEVTVTQTIPAPTSTSVRSSPAASSATFKPAPAASVAGVAPGQALPAGQVEGTCPYIATQDAADIEGNRIYRTSVLTTLKPVGCRFYFWCCDYQPTADILPMTFATAAAAHDAMILTGRAGANTTGVPNLVPGVDAVLYQTKFYGPDGPTDWAATFAKGRVMVTVHTQQNDVSFNAKNFAATIAPKF